MSEEVEVERAAGGAAAKTRTKLAPTRRVRPLPVTSRCSSVRTSVRTTPPSSVRRIPGRYADGCSTIGFTIPADIGPVLDEYTKEGFDFIALRVRPGGLGLGPVGLQPLRLTTPGADPTLPLRMSRAGVKGAAELTLFVLGEGRYRVQGFDEVPVAREALAFVSGDSNYDAVVGAQLAAGDGRRFVVEHVRRDSGSLSGWVSGLERQCAPSPNPPTLGGETNEHALADAGADASSPDAGDVEAAGDRDAASADGVDASSAAAPPPPSSPPSLTTCARTDLDAAMDGLNGPLWITRLHARLPASAFAADLRFEANPAQQEVASDYVIPASGGAMIAPARPAHAGTFVVFGLTVLGLGSFFKRRRQA